MGKMLILNDKKIDYLNDLIGEVYVRNPEESAYLSRDVVAVLDFIINTDTVDCCSTSTVDDSDDNDWK